jgi:3-oxoacyl-[acyl-carrier protein] reductase
MSEQSDVVIVTGSGGPGCGRAIARRFARTGASVIVSDVDDAGGAETVRLIEEGGGRALYCHTDVRDDTDVVSLFEVCEREMGPLSVLVNNASVTDDDAGGADAWMAPIDTDLLGAIRTIKHAVDAMRRAGHGGAIVNVSSISALWHGRTSPGGFEGYDVAKAGLIRLTTRLSSLADTDGIRVNCVAPGWIATDEVASYWTSLTPAQRTERGVPTTLLDPNDVAELVVQLAGDASLSGRVVAWWSEDEPRLIDWGDRGYRSYSPFRAR